MTEVSPEWTAELKKGSIQLCLLALLNKEEKYGFQILRELRDRANGGNVHASLEALGSPRDVGRHYREIYGYGTAFKLMFAAIAFLLAIPSVPVLVIGSETVFPFTLSIVFVVAAAAWILWVGVAAGTQAGIVAGLAGMGGRISAFGAVACR